eukprot:scaffold1358_cov36-Cyclotella_meneghiniana.AAC.2
MSRKVILSWPAAGKTKTFPSSTDNYILNGMGAHQECTHPSSTVSITGISKQIPRRFRAATPDQLDSHILYD